MKFSADIVGLMSNLRFHFSVTVRDRRVGYVDRQT